MEITYSEIEGNSSPVLLPTLESISDTSSTEDIQNCLSSMLEEAIPDDTICLSVIHKPVDPSVNTFPQYIHDFLDFLKDKEYNVFAYTTGLHLNGKEKIPHHHYHFMMTTDKGIMTNPAQTLQRWIYKTKRPITGCTMKWSHLDLTAPKYQFLSYPLKEGNLLRRFSKYTPSYFLDGQQMSSGMIRYLRDVGKAIYEKSIALKLRQDKMVERRQLALRDLFEIVKEQSFGSYRTMLEWLDDNYIATLELEQLPDPNQYKINCKKIAVKLGLLKYSDI